MAQLLHAGRPLSETAPFPWSRATLAADKSIFNLVPCANEYEKEFACFLQKADEFALARHRRPSDRFHHSAAVAAGSAMVSILDRSSLREA